MVDGTYKVDRANLYGVRRQIAESLSAVDDRLITLEATDAVHTHTAIDYTVQHPSEVVLVDSSAAAVTITLPASPSDNDYVGVWDAAHSAVSFPITILRNGNTIIDRAENAEIDRNSGRLDFVFDAGANTWEFGLVLGCAASGSLPVLVYATFTAVDGTPIASYNSEIDVVGGGFSDTSTPAATIQGNKLTGTQIAATGSRPVIDAGEENVLITANCGFFKSGGTVNTTAIRARYTGVNDYLYFGILSTTPTPWTWALIRYQGGSPTILDSAIGITSGDADISRELMATTSGNNLRFQVPAENIDLSVSDSFNNTVTVHGLRLNKTAAAPISNCADILIEDNS